MQSYCRQSGHSQGIHLDGVEGHYIDNAVNIPLQGCAGSRHVYYEGDYITVERTVNGLTFRDLIWKSIPKVADILYLDQPTLLRVNYPHSAQATSQTARWALTMRFQGNPSYELLCTRLKVISN
jgi:hypothetical protein